jgi:hypothetical protein
VEVARKVGDSGHGLQGSQPRLAGWLRAAKPKDQDLLRTQKQLAANQALPPERVDGEVVTEEGGGAAILGSADEDDLGIRVGREPFGWPGVPERSGLSAFLGLELMGVDESVGALSPTPCPRAVWWLGADSGTKRAPGRGAGGPGKLVAMADLRQDRLDEWATSSSSAPIGWIPAPSISAEPPRAGLDPRKIQASTPPTGAALLDRHPPHFSTGVHSPNVRHSLCHSIARHRRRR